MALMPRHGKGTVLMPLYLLWQALRMLDHSCDDQIDSPKLPLQLWATLEQQIKQSWQMTIQVSPTCSVPGLHYAMDPKQVFTWITCSWSTLMYTLPESHVHQASISSLCGLDLEQGLINNLRRLEAVFDWKCGCSPPEPMPI